MSVRALRHLADFTALMATRKYGKVPSGHPNGSQSGVCFGELLEDGQYERESISDLLPPPLSVLAEPEQTFKYTIGRLPALDVAGKAIAGH